LEFNIPFQHKYGYIRDDIAPQAVVCKPLVLEDYAISA